MRDLSQVSTGPNFRTSTNKVFLRVKLVVIIAVLIALGYFALNFVTSSGGGSSMILREAPRGLTPVAVGDSQVTTEGGVALVTQTALMRDVKHGGEATATVKRSFGGGIYILSVDATLPDPKNVNYQVWLVGDGRVVPIDYMRGSKTSWSLSLRDTDRYSQYEGVWITLERGRDDRPEEHVMEGSF